MSTPVQAISPSVNGWNAEYLAQLHEQYKSDPASLPADVRAFMQGFDLALASAPAPSAGTPAQPRTQATPAAAGPASSDDLRLALGVHTLIAAYRSHGHLASDTDPFHRPRPRPVQLTLAHHGLSESDLSKPAPTFGLPIPAPATLRHVVEFLESRYCSTTGYQFAHIHDQAQLDWFIQRIERTQPTQPSSEDRAAILDCILRSEQMERFLQLRYQGQKRFSLEGGESLIALMEWVIRSGAELGVEEVVMGMSHRGRINVLTNIVGKTYQQVFTEFEHNWHEDFVDGGGDVKYHRGYSGERTIAPGKKVALTLSFNPSHLESVNAVVEGRCRAKQRLRGDTDHASLRGTRARRRVLPFLIHGDAAVIGQGVVAESLNFSQLEGYRTGGTIHAVVNNLVGFTTDPEDARTSTYCTDMALMIEAPVLHVNGDDPEAVVAASRLATEYRQHFGRVIFIEMMCFRKYGHNEQDNAAITQPLLYQLINAHPGVATTYARKLETLGVIKPGDFDALRAKLSETLEAAQNKAKAAPTAPNIDPAGKRWKGFTSDYSHAPAKTGAGEELLREVCAAMGKSPEGFNLNPVVARTMAGRAALADQLDRKDAPIHLTYADAESLAFGTLLLEGTAVRISGQDARRGTFGHRNAVIRDQKTNAKFTPLNAMRPLAELPDNAGKPGKDGAVTQARLCVYDSPLSEYAVMGFDYGYSMADPNMLVCWEGQFGDFCNTAQVMIDQYIASAEIKWNRWSGLVLLLPHGYEGAGPEHSSARLERFLQLCADDNMQVIYPSTGAQIFHALRRQVRRNFRKPLIVMTPKSMLRLPTSRMDDLVHGHFEELIDDPYFVAHKETRRQVSRQIFCTGKFYHQLAARRDELKRFDTAIIRIEQFYPFHHKLAEEIMARYPAKVTRYWCQEEPRNAGAFTFLEDLFRHELKVESGLLYFGREASATPAVGDTHVSDEQQETILTKAIGPSTHAGGHAAGHAPAAASNGSHAPASPATDPAPAAKRSGKTSK